MTTLSPANVTRKLRQAGVTVTNVGRIDYRNDGVSYYASGEYTAEEFLKAVVAAGFVAHRFNGRVTVTALPA